MIDAIAIPKPLENGIRETEHQNVLDGFFAEVMVNAKDLLFARVTGELGVELMGGGQIVAERFFDDNALPACLAIFAEHARVVDLLDDFAELAGHRSEIEQDVVADGFAAE